MRAPENRRSLQRFWPPPWHYTAVQLRGISVARGLAASPMSAAAIPDRMARKPIWPYTYTSEGDALRGVGNLTVGVLAWYWVE